MFNRNKQPSSDRHDDPRLAELVQLAQRNEISLERFELEADWVATQEAARLKQERQAKRLGRSATERPSTDNT